MDDPMKKDKKALPLSGADGILAFLGSSLLLLPLCVAVLVPAAVLSLGVQKLVQSVSPRRRVDRSSELCYSAPNIDRKFDIVVFGVTGFTGKMAAKYIAKTYGNSISWAIAGRRKDALEAIQKEMIAINPALAHLPMLIADSTSIQSLADMAALTKVVISTAGPFGKYGSSLVRVCAELGTHYCDITGETDWVREMIDKFDDTARQTGARIVNFCGHDCIPWDLAVFECARKLKANGESLAEVRIFDELDSTPSGGTLATIFHALLERVVYKSQLGFDPLLKTLSGEKTTCKFTPKNQMMLGYSSEHKAWVGPFVMAAVMANCVRRSNAINNYGSNVVYRECAVYPSFMAGFANVLGLVSFGLSLVIPPLRALLVATVLPAPGQGPSEKSMDAGFLKLTARATGSNGGKACAMIYFPNDPGYRDTARMLVESGLCLALNIDQIRAPGGVHTPATCLSRVLLDRLVASGCNFSIN